MSYILDALKKAESDRQLGALPSLHGQPQSAEAPAQMRVWLMLIAALLALIAGLLLWRSLAENAPALPSTVVGATTGSLGASARSAASSPAASSPAAPLSAVATLPPVSNASALAPVPMAVVEAAPVANVAPVVASAPAVAAPVSPPVPQALAAPKLAEPAKVSSVPPAPPTVAVAKAVAQEPAVKAEAAEENLPLLSQLPELIQREVPPVAVKGFMYSQNPADRILVVGSNFHHEGDELAAGVKLEKLLPNAAILNFKGFRYRIAY